MEENTFILTNEPSEFRIWCQTMWQEQKTEVFNWTGKDVDYTSEQFFSKNRWHLKALYVSRGKDRWNF